MAISNKNKGLVIREYETGKRFLVNEVSAQNIICTDETGLTANKGIDMEYGIEKNDEQLNTFHQNSTISGILTAATAAAARKLGSKEMDPEEHENAVRVLGIVEEQRTLVEDRILEDVSKKKANQDLAEQFLSSMNTHTPGTQRCFLGINVTMVSKDTFQIGNEIYNNFEEAHERLSNLSSKGQAQAGSFEARLQAASIRSKEQQKCAENPCPLQTYGRE